MYGAYNMYYRFDWTYLLVLAGVLLSMIVSAKMKSTFAQYSRVGTRSNLTGAETARAILAAAGITDVRVQRVSGDLTDHYDPRNKVLRLSDSVYGSNSLSAVGVAAHECGHAIQHFEQYAPLTIRSAIVPVANIGSSLSGPIFVAGLIFSMRPLLTIGIVLFMGAVLFQLVTLPVEINASDRALQMLDQTGIMRKDELGGAKKVLSAAAMTYVAALASSLLQLLRLIILAGNRSRGNRDE